MLCEDKIMANEYLNKVISFLDNNLKLTLNSKTRIFKNKQGVNFCGYKIKILRSASSYPPYEKKSFFK